MEVLKIVAAIFVALNVCATVASNNFTYDSVKLDGPCPYISYITNYDMNAAIGWWYRAFSESANPFCLKNQGQTMYAVQYDNETIHIEVCCQSAIDPNVAVCGRDIGSGTAVAGSKPGSLTYYVQNKKYEIYVLYADYVSTGIAYGCNRGPQNERDEIVFVLSRDYKLDRVKENEVGATLKRNGIQWSKLIPSKQDDSIPYTGGPVQSKVKLV